MATHLFTAVRSERIIRKAARYLALCLLLVTASTAGLAQSGNTVTISGKSFTAPDTLLLLKPYEDGRHQGQRIPVRADSSFTYSFAVDTLAQYELVSLSEMKKGLWRQVAFFPDAEHIRFELLDLQNRGRSTIEGSFYTDRFYEFAAAMQQQWMPVFHSVLSGAGGLPEVQVKYKQDSLLREMMIWQLATLREYPKEIELALYYDALSKHKDNDLVRDVLQEAYGRIKDGASNQTLLGIIESILQTANNGLLQQPYIDFYLLRPEADSSLLSEQIPSNEFTIVDMWSPWCGPCIRKSQQLAANYTWLRDNGIKVIGIVGGIDTIDKFTDAQDRFQYPWSLYPEISNHQSLWSRYGFPNSGGGQVLIDKYGIVRAIDPTFEEIKSVVGN